MRHERRTVRPILEPVTPANLHTVWVDPERHPFTVSNQAGTKFRLCSNEKLAVETLATAQRGSVFDGGCVLLGSADGGGVMLHNMTSAKEAYIRNEAESEEALRKKLLQSGAIQG